MAVQCVVWRRQRPATLLLSCSPSEFTQRPTSFLPGSLLLPNTCSLSASWLADSESPLSADEDTACAMSCTDGALSPAVVHCSATPDRSFTLMLYLLPDVPASSELFCLSCSNCARHAGAFLRVLAVSRRLSRWHRGVCFLPIELLTATKDGQPRALWRLCACSTVSDGEVRRLMRVFPAKPPLRSDILVRLLVETRLQYLAPKACTTGWQPKSDGCQQNWQQASCSGRRKQIAAKSLRDLVQRRICETACTLNCMLRHAGVQ